MATIQTEVEVEGQAHEIELDTEDLGVIPEDEVRDSYVPREVMEDTIQQRIARATRGRFTIDDLDEDDDVLARIADRYSDRVKDALGIDDDANDVDVDKLRESIRSSEVSPLKEQLETLESQVNSLRVERLKATVAGVDAIREGLTPLIQRYYQDAAEWDPEYEDWFVVDDDGEFKTTSDPQKGKAPYMTIEEDLAEKHGSGEFDEWFKAQSRDGIGFGSTRPGGRGQTTLDDFKAMSDTERTKVAQQNPALYREFMDAITQEGEDALAKRNPNFA